MENWREERVMGGGRERGFHEKGQLEKNEDGKEAKDLSKERA